VYICVNPCNPRLKKAIIALNQIDVYTIIKTVNNGDSYRKIVASLKRRKKGATVADICASTALPLSTVHELLPKAADEYQGRLQVTQSGEILYLFPDGFKSRYRGLGVWLGRALQKSASFIKIALSFLFKVWIMVMLIGYFILFLALALASVFLSVAAKSSSSDRKGGGGFFGFRIFDLLIRLWFYSSLTKPSGNNRAAQKTKKGRPMHKAVFSFVFGEEDPNKDWQERQSRAIIEYVQANRGVISLPEYMAFTGESSLDAEQSLLAFCSRYSGSPEVTEEGTILYRFDDLLLRADSVNSSELSPPIKRLKNFSDNPKKMNGWFIAINAVNLIFGSYFLYQSFSAGQLLTELQYKAASSIYSYTHYFLQMVTADPVGIIRTVLGFTPLLFSIFFWLIPAVRLLLEKKENREIKLTNFKRFGFGKIWKSPFKIDVEKFLNAPNKECKPENLKEARDRVIKDIGAISVPEVEQNEEGKIVYSFNELENEKHALEKYRQGIDPARSLLGDTVFDSGE